MKCPFSGGILALAVAVAWSPTWGEEKSGRAALRRREQQANARFAGIQWVTISGGRFTMGSGSGSDPQVHNGADSAVPVDLYIPACPPHPLSILDGLLRLLDRSPAP